MVKNFCLCFIVIHTIIFSTGCGILVDNIHRVGDVEQRPAIYRSAQLHHTDLQNFLGEKRIDTVINMRGENKEKYWYKYEKHICNIMQVEHHDIRFSARSAPKKQNLIRLVEVLEDVRNKQKRVLIHCMAGADRTSFGSAVARMVVYGETAEQALSSFTLWYGHICLDGCALDNVLHVYLADKERMPFADWVRQKYKPELIPK